MKSSLKEKAYRLMLYGRELDKKMLILLRQGKSFFHTGCMGHEAVQAAAALSLDPKRDFLFPYYRDQVLALGMGMTPEECLLAFLGREGDPTSNGRQMPQHYGHPSLNIPSSSSSTGTQYLQAVGSALASMRADKPKDLSISLVCSGDGTTSQGDFHEALSWATRAKAPVIFLVENNGYAISVPLEQQRPGAQVADMHAAYPGLKFERVDGCNFEASYKTFEKAVKHARKGLGPVLIDASVVRLLPHSSSDDDKKYRAIKELEADKKRDPLEANKMLVSAKKREILEKEIFEEVDAAADRALAAPLPDVSTVEEFVYAPAVTSALSRGPEEHWIPGQARDDSMEAQGDSMGAQGDSMGAQGDSMGAQDDSMGAQDDNTGAEVVLVDAINRALADELERDERVLVFGQDVAGAKGGVFTATRGLTDKFGAERCFNAPLAESSIVGVAIGMALRGLKPVPEIQFADYIWTAMMQIRNELSVMRYRSNNAWPVPVVIRVPVGGYIHGGLCHSQNIEAIFSHFPGLKVVLPSTALDAYGLLKSAIRDDDPVLFLEHKSLYRQNFAKSRLPENKDWCLPIGKGIIRTQGSDITIVTYGALVQRALDVVRELEQVSVEVIDLRSIRPYDFDLVAQSVRKTGRVLVLHEDTRFMGFGAELAAEISEKCFQDLDAPVRRLAGLETPVPYATNLEEQVLPQPSWIEKAIRELLAY
ncbi:MAG: dehydrogenase E1 component subunit alpha/beta [Deltaproteobacteria bacterium]|nr:dehydrogenase E1 component subunit alpha/beta [Deltaproteobacteria bacterium]